MKNTLLYYFLCLFGVSERASNKVKFNRRSRVKAENESSLPEQLCRRFSLNEILAATFNFDSKLVIGRGGTGIVYKGFMDNGTLVVAVKRLSSRSLSRKKGLEEFRNEVQLLCQLCHRHLVSLIGFCHEKDVKILVYNYMSNGSLYDHLHHGNIGYDPLSWKQRLEICIGAARGLHYLHSGAKRAIIHRDIKTKNILLDDQLVSKLSDFGLSKIGPFSMSKAPIKIELPRFRYDSLTTTLVGGTMGYLDPEFFRNETLVTDKSDVYSFGVVLFEVLCGRKVIKRDVEEEDQGNKRPSLGEVEAALELALEIQIEADSKWRLLYEEVGFTLSAFNISDYVVDLFEPHESSSNVHSFKSEGTISDISEGLQHGSPDNYNRGYSSDSDF